LAFVLHLSTVVPFDYRVCKLRESCRLVQLMGIKLVRKDLVQGERFEMERSGFLILEG